MNVKFRHLEQLLGGYFHQDWDVEGENDVEVIEVYIKSVCLKQLAHTVSEIDMLLESCQMAEGELENILIALGCDYYRADGFSAFDWLLHIRAILMLAIERADVVS